MSRYGKRPPPAAIIREDILGRYYDRLNTYAFFPVFFSSPVFSALIIDYVLENCKTGEGGETQDILIDSTLKLKTVWS